VRRWGDKKSCCRSWGDVFYWVELKEGIMDEITRIAKELNMKNITERCAICEGRGFVFETIMKHGLPYQVMKACSCHRGDEVAEGLKFFPSDTKREHPVRIKRIDV